MTILKKILTKILGSYNDSHIGFLNGMRAIAVLLVFLNHIWANRVTTEYMEVE